MIIHRTELTKSNLKGTIIDIETIGGFCNCFNDSRMYQEISPTVFGYIDRNALTIRCAKGQRAIEGLKERIIQVLPTLQGPLFAFNCCFERGVLFHSCGVKLDFKGELNKEKFESKGVAVTSLGIGNYDDPFFDRGYECVQAWLKKQYRLVIKHNRSCLLKERDILLKRGHREPDALDMISSDDIP